MSEKKVISKNPLSYLMGLIQMYTILIVFMILGMIKSSDIWYDEVFSVRFAQLRMDELIEMASRDVHPPLYYIYLKICMKFFGFFGLDVIQASKVASCIPVITLLIFAIIRGKKRLNGTATTLFAFLIVTLPCLSSYYVEIRMYSLALMFITFEYAAMTDILESKEKKTSQFIVMFFMALAAAYTQYFAGIAAATVYIVLLAGILVTKKEKSYLYTVIGMAVSSIVLYLPWLPVFLKQLREVSGSYWIQPMTLRSLPGCLKFMFMPQIINTKAAYALAGLMIALCFISYILFFTKKPDKKDVILVIGGPFAALLIVLVGYVFSLMGSPIFTYRYLIPVMGIICLNISRVIADRKSNAAMYFIIFFCVILGYVSFDGFYNEEIKKGNAWKEAQIRLSEIEPKSAVITNFDHVMTICAYYLKDDDIYLYEDEAEAVIKDLLGGCDSIDDDGIKRLLKERDNVYFFGSFNVRDEIVKDWEKNGICAEYTGECLVERYWFNIYRLSAK
ncbi:MAG: hypothetical protein J6Z05_11085 [Lachnospiraceae bacterium]|nr:hypothetical protein [Lachnospiraceae bacterium]